MGYIGCIVCVMLYVTPVVVCHACCCVSLSLSCVCHCGMSIIAIYLGKMRMDPIVTYTRDPIVTDTRDPSVTDTRDPTFTETRDLTVTDTRDPTVTDTMDPSVTDTRDPTFTETRDPIVTDTRDPTVTDTRDPTVTVTYGASHPLEILTRAQHMCPDVYYSRAQKMPMGRAVSKSLTLYLYVLKPEVNKRSPICLCMPLSAGLSQLLSVTLCVCVCLQNCHNYSL